MDFAVIQRYRGDLIAVAALVLLWGFFFWRLITPTAQDQLVIDYNGDFGSQFYNFSVYHASRFTAGDWIPLWNPYNYAGGAFLADPQWMAAYPVRWLFLNLYADGWNYFSLELEVMTHFLIASLLMYVFTRRVTGSVLGGMIGALAFAYGPFLHVFPVQQMSVLTTIIWLPLVMLGIHEGTRPPYHWRWFVVGGIGMGLCFLGGHPQMAMGVGYFAAAYHTYRVYTGSRSWQHWLTGGALFGVIGIGISAILLLPAAEFLQMTSRAEEFNYVGKGTGYFFQNIFQTLWTVPGLASYWYIGISLLPLIGLAIYHQREQVSFWVICAGLMLLLGFGTKTSVFQGFYVLLPGFSIFRNPERYLFIWSFSLAVLAAIGAGYLWQSQRREFRWALWGGAGLAALYFLLIYNQTGGEYDQLNKEMAGYTLVVALLVAVALPVIAQHSGRQAFLVGLVIFDLFSVSQGHAFNYIPGVPEDVLQQPPGWVQDVRGLLAETPNQRIDTTNQLGSLGSLYQLPDLQGASPLRVKNTHQLLNLPPEKRWKLFAVRYVITTGEVANAERLPLTHQDYTGAALYIYELHDPRPLATIVYSADVFAEDEAALQVISAPDYPIRERVVLPEFPAIQLPSAPAEFNSVEIERFEPEKLQAKVVTRANGLMVIAIPYHPGWVAQVGSQEVDIQRANVGLMAVPVEAGTHLVTLEFKPRSFTYGWRVSLVTWLLALILLIFPTVKSRLGYG